MVKSQTHTVANAKRKIPIAMPMREVGKPTPWSGRRASAGRTRSNSASGGRGSLRRGWRLRRGRLLPRPESLDRLDHLRIVTHVLDEEHLPKLDDHRLLWTVQLRAALHELAELLRLRLIGVGGKVENIGQRE